MAFIRDIFSNRLLYLLALPGILFLAVFAYIPILGQLLAFKKYSGAKGIWGSEWVGLDNFRFFFKTDAWLPVTFNTLYLNALFIVFGLGTALVLAMLLNEIRHALTKKLAQSAIFLPYFVSWLTVSMMSFMLFSETDGVLNKMLVQLHAEPVAWYLTPKVWPTILTIIYVWKFSGYFSIIFLAAITSMDAEYYESARIDGASRFQQMRHITMPLLVPTVLVLALLGVGRIFYGDFGMIYGIIGDNGVLFPTTDVIDTYAYRALRQFGNFSMASAVTFYQSVMGLIFILVFNFMAKKIDPDAGLF